MKKELIEKICKSFDELPWQGTSTDLETILRNNLPDFQRIDWERLRDCFEKASNGYVSSHLYVAVKEYNSTLPPALVPLPKEMPKDLVKYAMGHDVYEVWDKIISEYGTPANKLQPLPKATPYEFVGLFNESHSPRKIWEWLLSHYGTPEPKPNLPSYHDLFKELYQISVKTQSTILVSTLTKHIIKKYSLHPREWWQDLKEGDKFMYAGEAYEYYGYEVNIRGEVTLWGKSTWKFRLSQCTPYTPPSAQDIIAKHNLSDEEVKAIREGR